MQNLLSFAKLLQGFPHGNDFPEKLAKDGKRAGHYSLDWLNHLKRDAPQWHLLQTMMAVEAR